MPDKYSKYGGATKIEERPWNVHPIWRGLGCTMLILLPMMSFLTAVSMIQGGVLEMLNIPHPEELQKEVIPSFDFLGTTYVVDIMTVILTLLLMLIGFALLMILYSLVYSMIGPPRYGPLDVKPERPNQRSRIKTKR